MRRDFYFSVSEARGEHFSAPGVLASAAEYRLRDGTFIWATEVTAPGAKPISASGDLLLVARNVSAEFVRRTQIKQGDLWGQLSKAPEEVRGNYQRVQAESSR